MARAFAGSPWSSPPSGPRPWSPTPPCLERPTAGSFAPVRLRAVVIGGALREQVPAGVADKTSGSIGTGVWRGWKAIRLDWRRRLFELR